MKYLSILLILLSITGFAKDDLEQVFKEEMRFGVDEEEPPYEWQDADWTCNFEVAHNGHIFVIDQRNTSIHEFDANGKHIRQLARKGEGPGEYVAISGIFSTAANKIVGLNFQQRMWQLNHYDGSAKFLEATKVPNQIGYPFAINFTNQTGIYHGIGWGEDRSMRLQLIVLDNQMNKIKTISDHPWSEMGNQDFNDPSAWTENISRQIKFFMESAKLGAGVLHDGRVVVGNGPKGTFEVYNADMSKVLKTMTVEVKAKPFPEDNRDQLVELITGILFKQMGPSIRSIVTPTVVGNAVTKADLPPAHVPVYSIFPVKDNTFAAITDINFGRGFVTLTFYDTEHGELGTAALPDPGIFSVFGTRLKFHNDKVYAMVWNADDENQIVRYSYNLKALKK